VVVVEGGFDVVVCVVVEAPCVVVVGNVCGTNVVVVGGSCVVGGTADVVVTVVLVVVGVSEARRHESIVTLRHARRMERLHARFPARRNSRQSCWMRGPHALRHCFRVPRRASLVDAERSSMAMMSATSA
jgi:hypothetical protein